jgi:hypothetical protein
VDAEVDPLAKLGRDLPGAADLAELLDEQRQGSPRCTSNWLDPFPRFAERFLDEIMATIARTHAGKPETGHQGLGGMCKPREPGQPEKAASAFDGMHQPEDRVERLEIVRLLLETHELDIELIETFPGLGQEFGQ